jgi:hypothetical protein
MAMNGATLFTGYSETPFAVGTWPGFGMLDGFGRTIEQGSHAGVAGALGILVIFARRLALPEQR